MEPKNWNVYLFRDILERVEVPVNIESNKEYVQIGIRSHGKGLFYKEPVLGKALGNKQVFWIQPNCFILNVVFAWEQAITKTTENEIGMIGSHRFPMYRPKNDLVDIDYLIYYFLTKRGTDILEAASPGGAGRNRTLGQERFLKSKITLPTLPEQQKIAAILSTQDKVIELKEKLLVQKQQQKKYLMQQLLTGKKRLPGFNGEWQFAKLENVSKYSASAASFKTYESHLGCGPYPVYDATGCFGNVDFYENEQPYISIVKDGAGAGRVALCKAKSSTIGTLGCIFANDIDLLYLFYWMSAVDFQIYSNGSTIPHVYYKDYKNVQVHLPCRLEQEAIVEILSTADHEIDLLQKSIEAEKQKKKALMQLLLTGKVSVRI